MLAGAAISRNLVFLRRILYPRNNQDLIALQRYFKPAVFLRPPTYPRDDSDESPDDRAPDQSA
jgi:hypothetical protein